MKQLLWLFPPDERLTTAAIGADYSVGPIGSLAILLQQLERTKVEMVFVSPQRNERNPVEILTKIRATNATVPVVMFEPEEEPGDPIRTTEAGALFYRGEPGTPEKLLEIIRIASNQSRAETPRLLNEPWRKDLIGDSSAMQEVVETISLVGNRRSTVLITGETGTGKEIAARAVHLASSRARLPMVAINCAALPEHLLEAELFGHTKGAFTGAFNARVGLFEMAQGSTIFLDEIGDMPLQLQAKLLRVLQEREIHRVGSSQTIHIDVRVIAASNVDLESAVAQKRFRQDLFYRLNVVPLRMPALRERLSDIPRLVDHFIRKISDLESTPEKVASTEVTDYLMSYSWPGNVRQLEHAVESAIALSGVRRMLRPSDFRLPEEQAGPELGVLADLDVPESGINLEQLMGNIERKLMERALVKCRGNKARAADLLSMKRTTLVSKFKALQSFA